LVGQAGIGDDHVPNRRMRLLGARPPDQADSNHVGGLILDFTVSAHCSLTVVRKLRLQTSLAILSAQKNQQQWEFRNPAASLQEETNF
jgi:hypothetical protein